MKEATAKLLERSARAVETARRTLAMEDPEAAMARAYYAMFYAAEALLFERGLAFRKHTGVHAAFAEHLVKPGVLDGKYHRWLLEAFEQRIIADYEVTKTIRPEDAAEAIRRAGQFLEAARRHLESGA